VEAPEACKAYPPAPCRRRRYAVSPPQSRAELAGLGRALIPKGRCAILPPNSRSYLTCSRGSCGRTSAGPLPRRGRAREGGGLRYGPDPSPAGGRRPGALGTGRRGHAPERGRCGADGPLAGMVPGSSRVPTDRGSLPGRETVVIEQPAVIEKSLAPLGLWPAPAQAPRRISRSFTRSPHRRRDRPPGFAAAWAVGSALPHPAFPLDSQRRSAGYSPRPGDAPPLRWGGRPERWSGVPPESQRGPRANRRTAPKSKFLSAAPRNRAYDEISNGGCND